MIEEKPTEILEQEHRFIQKVVGTFAVLTEELEAGRKAAPETLWEIAEFMRTFADRCHHGKEETQLFPFLESRGVPVRGCPLAILAEHQRSRLIVAGLAAAADKLESGHIG